MEADASDRGSPSSRRQSMSAKSTILRLVDDMTESDAELVLAYVSTVVAREHGAAVSDPNGEGRRPWNGRSRASRHPRTTRCGRSSARSTTMAPTTWPPTTTKI
jgi:hypothetical protein